MPETAIGPARSDDPVTDRVARLRSFFARYVTLKGGAKDPRIKAAFAAVPREPFAGPAPWQIRVPGGPYIPTPDDDPAYLYHDWLVALDAGRGINIGEPALHARCLDALGLRQGEKVLHGIGMVDLVGSNTPNQIATASGKLRESEAGSFGITRQNRIALGLVFPRLPCYPARCLA